MWSMSLELFRKSWSPWLRHGVTTLTVGVKVVHVAAPEPAILSPQLANTA